MTTHANVLRAGYAFCFILLGLSLQGCSSSPTSGVVGPYAGRVTSVTVERVGATDAEVGSVWVKTEVELEDDLGSASFTSRVTVTEQGDDPFTAGATRKHEGESDEQAAIRLHDLRVGDRVEVTDYDDGSVDYKKIGN